MLDEPARAVIAQTTLDLLGSDFVEDVAGTSCRSLRTSMALRFQWAPAFLSILVKITFS